MRSIRLASLIATFLLASTLEVAFAQTADRERLCREFFLKNSFTTTLTKHLPAFRLDPDRGIVVDAKAKKYIKSAGLKHWPSEIAHTLQFGDGKTELSVLQINDEGGDPRKFTLSELSPEFSKEIKARMFKYYVEFRNGHCLPARVEQLSPETDAVTVLADFDECQAGEAKMCAKYPNLETLKKRFPPERPAGDARSNESDSSEHTTRPGTR